MIDRWIDLFSHLGSILEANLDPCWPLFRLKWGDHVVCRPFFIVLTFFLDTFAVLAPCWRHLFSILVPLGAIWALFWKCLVPLWSHVGAKLALTWGSWAQELALDGLVGLLEAQRMRRARPCGRQAEC